MLFAEFAPEHSKQVILLGIGFGLMATGCARWARRNTCQVFSAKVCALLRSRASEAF